jgi:hypothetical protein
MHRVAKVFLGVAFLGGCGTHTAIGSLADGGGMGGVVVDDGGSRSGGGGGGGGGGDGGIAVGPDGSTLDAVGCGHGVGGHRAGPGASSVSFNPSIDYPSTEADTNRRLVPCDINGDGKLDLVIGGSTAIRTRINLGDGRFGEPVAYDAVGGSGNIGCGDLDGDGANDIAVTSGRVTVFRNDGHGAFGAPMSYAAGQLPVALAVGDLNGDGKLDIAVANAASDGDVGVLISTGNRTFAGANFPAGQVQAALALGDFDGDCLADVVVGNAGMFSVLSNRGGGALGPARPFSAGVFPFGIAVGDLDGDGRLDILLGEISVDTVDVALGYGDGTFSAAAQYPVTSGAYQNASGSTSVVLSDFDSDGDLDLVAVNHCCGIGIKLNDGHGVFGPTQVVTYPGVASWPLPLDVAAADFNGDGKPDLAIADEVELSILINSSH